MAEKSDDGGGGCFVVLLILAALGIWGFSLHQAEIEANSRDTAIHARIDEVKESIAQDTSTTP